jgi:hypothetical protein
METFKLEWLETKREEIPDCIATAFFALMMDGNLLYIGSVFRENLKWQINAKLDSLSTDERRACIWIGYINPIQTTYKRVSDSIARDTEKLLSLSKRSDINRGNLPEYDGRRNFSVCNDGLDILPEMICCDDSGKIWQKFIQEQ